MTKAPREEGGPETRQTAKVTDEPITASRQESVYEIERREIEAATEYKRALNERLGLIPRETFTADELRMGWRTLRCSCPGCRRWVEAWWVA